jgi:hypothetical protein
MHPNYFFSYSLGLSYASAIIQTLENRKTLDKLGGGPNSLFSVASSAPSSSSYLPMEIESRSGGTDKQLQVDATIRNLKNIGMNEHTEDKLLVFKNIIRKIDLFRKS